MNSLIGPVARRFATALPCLALAAGIAHAEPVFPPGSRIGLEPPAMMVMSRGVSGFNDPRTGTAIVLIEMPTEAYPGLAASFEEGALKASGFAVASRETVTIDGHEALLVAGEQNEAGRSVPKTVLLAPGPSMTALVLAQAPIAAPASVREDVLRALRTVAIRPPLSLDQQIASLPFQVGDPASFRPVRVMAGNSALFTDGPADSVRGAEQPIVIVAQSFAPPPGPDSREAFARAALTQNFPLRETMVERSQAFRQGGAEWHEIVARGKDGPSGEDVVVMQTIRFAPDSYLRMVGVTRSATRDANLPRFRRVADSVALR